MAKYRKKPIVIEATQWVGNPKEMPYPPAPHNLLNQRMNGDWDLKTSEGWYRLTPGDWIIRGIAGEYYPCKPNIFEATYEPVEEKPSGTSELDKD